MAKARPITGLDSQASTIRNARIVLQERLADMYAYARYIESPENTQELHDLRIAAKRVRYTLEIFEEFLPTASKNFAEELAKLQDELGTLHDSEVMLALLRQLLQQANGEAAAPNEEFAAKAPVLLSPDLEKAVLHPTHASSLSDKERLGLISFLRKQEQRREQSFLAFRQHWDQLEQRRFRAEILDMLNA